MPGSHSHQSLFILKADGDIIWNKSDPPGYRSPSDAGSGLEAPAVNTDLTIEIFWDLSASGSHYDSLALSSKSESWVYFPSILPSGWNIALQSARDWERLVEEMLWPPGSKGSKHSVCRNRAGNWGHRVLCGLGVYHPALVLAFKCNVCDQFPLPLQVGAEASLSILSHLDLSEGWHKQLFFSSFFNAFFSYYYTKTRHQGLLPGFFSSCEGDLGAWIVVQIGVFMGRWLLECLIQLPSGSALPAVYFYLLAHALFLKGEGCMSTFRDHEKSLEAW